MWTSFVLAFWFFLPAGIGNATPILANIVPYLNRFTTPMDFGKSYRGIRIFGDNKTLRGLFTGVTIAILIAFIQKAIYLNSQGLQSMFSIDYGKLDPLLFGFLSGFGALIGDAVKSFFKRRTNIKPGDTWFPFDQIDYIVGGLLFISLYYQLTLDLIFWIFLVYFGLHLLSSYVGFLLQLKQKPI